MTIMEICIPQCAAEKRWTVMVDVLTDAVMIGNVKFVVVDYELKPQIKDAQ